ncbi:MAG: hypothetical protein RJA41_710 [Actinomycetota bacterium]
MTNSNAPKPNKLHQISAPILLFIHSLPRVVFPLVTAGILLGGLFATNSTIGGVLLLLLGAILGWLIALSWSLLTPTARVVRSFMLVVVFGYALSRLIGGN